MRVPLDRAVVRAATIAAAALSVLAAPGPVVGQPSAERPADGFDHIAHQGDVIARAVPPPPCARCHRVAPSDGRLVGAPGHAACFGDCHGPAPRPRRRANGRPDPAERDRMPVCSACHRPAQIARLERGTGERIAAAFPPYQGDRDFALTISHAAHAQVERGCRTCHAIPPEPGHAGRSPDILRRRAERAAAPHRRCAACHDRRRAGGVDMDSCSACHSPAVGPDLAPRREPGLYPVRSRFSHRRHLDRMTGAGDACRACHEGVLTQSGERVPTPRKEQCRPCHDGTRAFSLVEPSCRRCHGPPEREGPSPGLLATRFAHRAHVTSDLGLACASCHTLDAQGAPIAASGGHAPCSDAACHAGDFAAVAPVICGVCHVRGEPWRDLHVDPAPAGLTEFGVDFSHRTHLADERAGQSAPCTRCHRVAADTGRVQPSPGHAACAGSSCHAPVRGGAPPPLSQCGGCHALGSADRHERSRRLQRWSVRQRFTHTPHRAEPSDPDRPLRCIECHTGTLASQRLGDMTAPPKQSCARCHDGGAAFKLTGHTCVRCHSTPLRTATGSTSETAR